MNGKKDSDFSDIELLYLIKKDKLKAFEELYKRYWKILYGTAFKRVKSNEIAEEIVQDIFINFWNKRENIEITVEVKNYLLRSVSNLVIDYFRREFIRNKYLKHFESNEPIEVNPTEQEINLNDTKTTIAKIVNDLPEKCRIVYEISRNQFKTNKEIAKLLDISEKTVENQITKALKRIKKGLA